MPLRDHFRSPLDDKHSWDELHAMWPATIVQQLVRVLPKGYFAAPGVHLRTRFEIDVNAFEDLDDSPSEFSFDDGDGGVAVATYAPPKPTQTLKVDLPDEDTYEVRVYDERHSRRGRRLVAAIEILSPANKDRPESRGAFVNKVASLLKQDVCVSLVDVVSTKHFNMYAQLLQFAEGVDTSLGEEPPHLYAVTIRHREEKRQEILDCWYHSLAIGQSLPKLPIWISSELAVPLDLESSYEETCRTLRIR
jgi:Protein of unknown function (DUF4058)